MNLFQKDPLRGATRVESYSVPDIVSKEADIVMYAKCDNLADAE